MDYQVEYNELMILVSQNQIAEKQYEAKYKALAQNIANKYAQEYPPEEQSFVMQSVLRDTVVYAELVEGQYENNTSQHYTSLEEMESNYPEFKQLKPIWEQKYQHHKAAQQYQTQITQLQTTQDQPDKDASQQMNNIQSGNDNNAQQTIATASSDGHVYPVAMVQSWTKELESANKQLKSFLQKFQQLNLDKIDRMWLRKQIQRFSKWIKEKLSSIRLKIVLSLKGMMKPIKEALAIIEPLLKPPSLDTIITWANNIIKAWMGPYEKVVTFIKDCTTYTPPLVSKTTALASTASTAPVIITNKAAELTGEGASIIQEEIANAVGDISFEPISIGDVM